MFPLKRARSISTAAVIRKNTDIKTKPDEVLTCCIQGQTNLRYILYKAAVLVHSRILKLENKTFKKYFCPKPKKCPISVLDVQCRFASLNSSSNCGLDQQGRRNPLRFKSLLKGKGSVKDPQDVHTREAEVHSPVEGMSRSLRHVPFPWITLVSPILTPASLTPWS